jgi:hypothetical protein
MGCSTKDLQTLSQTAAGWLVGLSPRTLRDKHDLERNADGTYDARKLLAWAILRQSADPDISLLAGGDSPNLERLRKLKADREEIALAKDRNEVISVTQLSDLLSLLASLLRRCGGKLGQRFGPDAQQLMNDTLDDFDRHVKAGLPAPELVGTTTTPSIGE